MGPAPPAGPGTAKQHHRAGEGARAPRLREGPRPRREHGKDGTLPWFWKGPSAARGVYCSSVSSAPAAIAVPITPATFGPIAYISR